MRYAAVMILMALSGIAAAASISGTVTDASGKAIENARIDHTGKPVVVLSPSRAIKPSPDEIRTDSGGRFHVLTTAPAIVIRKTGYESRRIRITGDAHLHVTLTRIRTTSRCKLAAQLTFRTKEADDFDYTAKWFLVETKHGLRGILSGRGRRYSFGAPEDRDVWTSVKYSEFMDENGIIDAAGHTADGKYWRSRSIYGAEAQYFDQTREAAEQLDCVMDRIPIHAW